ncbi:MAG: hypothetical protein GF364_04055 [Candidatus Lokiarchaeota archaeon]|nr:hypothetical protein [Candidatus Lokiarchaeota archaeon]
MNIEQSFIIGLISSTEFITQVRSIINIKLIDSPSAKEISKWCLEYYDKYKKAPEKDIQLIYEDKLKNNEIRKDVIEDIENVLQQLSDVAEQENLNVKYLVDSTKKYFHTQILLNLRDNLDDFLEKGDLTQADNLIHGFHGVSEAQDSTIDVGARVTLKKIEEAFKTSQEFVIEYPGDLGKLLNDKMVKGRFVGFFAREKSKKSFILLKSAMLAIEQKQTVAWFQAGDMTEDEIFIRLGIMLTGKTNMELNSGKQYENIVDCVYNQNNDCDLDKRACTFGIFEGEDPDNIRNTKTKAELVEAYKENKDYIPCRNCNKFKGCQWLHEITIPMLTVREVKSKIRKTIPENMFKMAVYPTHMLTIKEMQSVLNKWEMEGFIPNLIVVDYADWMVADQNTDSRNAVNQIWGGLRGISQEKNSLLLTASLVDSNSYNQDTIHIGNFSEDKRKLGHVSALFSINMSADGREEELEVVRIGEMLDRHRKKINIKNQVRVIQNLNKGNPILDSYW